MNLERQRWFHKRWLKLSYSKIALFNFFLLKMFSCVFWNTIILTTIWLWKQFGREYTCRLISTVVIVDTYFPLLTLFIHSHSLILRYCRTFNYIHHPMIYLRRYSNFGLSNGLVMMSAYCSFFSIKTIFEALFLISSLKWCHLTEICF